MGFIKGLLKGIYYLFLGAIFIVCMTYVYGKYSEYTGEELEIESGFFETNNAESRREGVDGINGYNEFNLFLKGLDLEGVTYMSLLSKCLYYYSGDGEESACIDAEEELVKTYNGDQALAFSQMQKSFITNQGNISEIQKNDYIAIPPTHTSNGGIIKNNPNKLSLIPFKHYSSALMSLSYLYALSGNYDSAILILKSQQNFISYLEEKSDLSIVGSIVLLDLERNNLDAIKYLLDNHKLTRIQKEKLHKSINNNYLEGVIDNGVKNEYLERIFYIDNTLVMLGLNNPTQWEILLFKFSFSTIENLALEKYYFYTVLSQKENYKKSDLVEYPLQNNISNIAGRMLYKNKFDYSDYYKQENELIQYKSEIVKLLEFE